MVIIGSFQYPESPILCAQEDTKANLDGADLGYGMLYISESTVSWGNAQGHGFTLDYSNITLHGISSDPNVCESKCIYIMINGQLAVPGCDQNLVQVNGNDDNSDCESDSDPKSSRLLLIPVNPDCVNTLFTALSQGQSLNPDPEDCMTDDEEDDNIYDDAVGFSDEADNSQGCPYEGDVNSITSQLQSNSIRFSCNGENGDCDDNQFEDVD